MSVFAICAEPNYIGNVPAYRTVIPGRRDDFESLAAHFCLVAWPDPFSVKLQSSPSPAVRQQEFPEILQSSCESDTLPYVSGRYLFSAIYEAKTPPGKRCAYSQMTQMGSGHRASARARKGDRSDILMLR